MTNKQRQKSLDKKKWLESETWDMDCSGAMPYCDFCGKRYIDDHGEIALTICDATQEERESECLCAKAYNRMRRA